MEGTILNGELLLSKNYEAYAWVILDRIKDYPLTPWLNKYIKNNKNPFGDIESEIEEINNRNQRRYETIHEDTEDNIILEKLNYNFKKDENQDYINEAVLKNNTDDIIIEHDDIVPDKEDIVSDIDVHTDNTDNVEHAVTEKESPIKKSISKSGKLFDMNINKEHNMKDNVNKIKKVIKENEPKEHQIKIIHKNEKTPHIRTEKESTEKVSFNSENIKRNSWAERLNRINRTDANNKKKQIPRPKGQRK